MEPDQFPEAMHRVALVEDQVKLEDPPGVIDEGLAERVRLGGGGRVGVGVGIGVGVSVGVGAVPLGVGVGRAWVVMESTFEMEEVLPMASREVMATE